MSNKPVLPTKDYELKRIDDAKKALCLFHRRDHSC